MPKKKLKKSGSRPPKNAISISRIKIIFFAVIFLSLAVFSKSMISADHYKVLGTSTFLAKGDDSGGGGSGSEHSSGGGSESSNSGSSGGSSSGSSSSGGGSSDSGKSGSSGGGSSESNSGGSNLTNVSESTRVTCTGPDGKQFQASFKDCEELNRAWNKPVRFNTLPNQPETQRIEPTEAPKVENKVEIKLTEQKTETELPEADRIRIETKDGTSRIDITSGKIKTRLEVEDDKVVVKAEQEDGTEVELGEDSIAKIDDKLEKDDIRVATAGASKFLVQKGNTGAVTDFPVSVNLATNTLFVNTPNGQKEITVLPEQAIQNLIKAKVLSGLGTKPTVVGGNTNVSSVNQLVTLSEKNGIPVYDINGVSDQKLFGIIPVKIDKNVVVSAETGNALSIDQSFGSKFLDAISF